MVSNERRRRRRRNGNPKVDNLLDQLKSLAEGLAANIMLNLRKPGAKMRNYKIVLRVSAKTNKKTLTKALKGLQSQVSRVSAGAGRSLLTLLNKLGILVNQFYLDDIKTEMKGDKGIYSVVITMAVKCENKESLSKIVASVEQKLKGLPRFVIFNVLGVPNDSIQVEEYCVEVE
jgi:hypothetical protein